MRESAVSTTRVVVFVAAMLALFLVGLVAAREWFPEPAPVVVTDQCRRAFDQYAIEANDDSLAATAAACTSRAEFFKAGREILDMDSSEDESFLNRACGVWSSRNTAPRPCLWTDSNDGY